MRTVNNSKIHQKHLPNNIFRSNGIGYFFLFFSSTNSNDVKIIKVVNDKATIRQHHLAVNCIKKEFLKPLSLIFKDKPKLLKRLDYEARESYKFHTEIPTTQEVYY